MPHIKNTSLDPVGALASTFGVHFAPFDSEGLDNIGILGKGFLPMIVNDVLVLLRNEGDATFVFGVDIPPSFYVTNDALPDEDGNIFS